MFSLIITIVAIALVVALVAATMYHGGDTLTQGRATADAAAFVTGAQQISGAAVMYKSLDSMDAADVPALVTAKFLASAPVVKQDSTTGAWVIDSTNKVVTNVVASDDVCTAINRSAGVPEAKVSAAAAADIANLPYGCVSTGRAFSFKF